MISPSDLIGTWRLQRWTAEAVDRGVSEPFGSSPEGILVYTADGTMVTTMTRAGRPSLGGRGLLAGSPDELAAVARSFVAYSGRWRLDGGDVLHEVEISLHPDWVGTVQRRHLAIDPDGQTLVLSSDPMAVGESFGVQRLEWRRAAGTSPTPSQAAGTRG